MNCFSQSLFSFEDKTKPWCNRRRANLHPPWLCWRAAWAPRHSQTHLRLSLLGLILWAFQQPQVSLSLPSPGLTLSSGTTDVNGTP